MKDGLEEVDQAQLTSLSISNEQFHSDDLKIPLTSIKGIWKKAEELLVQPDTTVAAPGCEKGSKMVKSKSGKQPHLVKCGKGGRISCDNDCPNWKSLGICSHCVAVAQSNSCLQEHTDFFRRSKHLPSIMQLLLTGLLGGLGNKKNRVS